MKHQYYIFDMDGTLVDSTKYWDVLQRDYLRSKGVSDEDIAIVRPITQPMTTIESGGFYIKRFGFEGTAESVAAEVNAIIAEHYRLRVQLKPGVWEFLEARKAEGAKMCIASATAKPLVLMCMEKLDIAKYFEFVMSCEEVGSGKDKPTVFIEAARRMGAAPEQCAVYEDSLVAATSAKSAGFHVVGVYDEYAAHNWEAMQTVAHELVTEWTNIPM